MDIKRQLGQLRRGAKRVLGGGGGFADPNTLGKASSDRFVERHREIVSDPLNMLIARVPQAGYIDREGYVTLHNGNRADFTGPYAYYKEFSDILIINRGVHEPLEEFCFQQMLKRIARPDPVMIELGAYWAHYSMWMKHVYPAARCFMVEPDPHNADSGRRNFEVNGYEGQFIVDFVGSSAFGVDRFLTENGIGRVDLLHSDIQGWEIEMLDGASKTLGRHAIDYVFVSTHSGELHTSAVERLLGFGYRVEVSSDFDLHTTSYDGFVLASSPAVAPVFEGFQPMGRMEIANATPAQLAQAVSALIEPTPAELVT